MNIRDKILSWLKATGEEVVQAALDAADQKATDAVYQLMEAHKERDELKQRDVNSEVMVSNLRDEITRLSSELSEVKTALQQTRCDQKATAMQLDANRRLSRDLTTERDKLQATLDSQPTLLIMPEPSGKKARGRLYVNGNRTEFGTSVRSKAGVQQTADALGIKYEAGAS